MGTVLAFFHSLGNLPKLRQLLKIIEIDLHSLSLTFKYQVIGVVHVRAPAVARRILEIIGSTSFHPAVYLGVFLELNH